MSKKIFSLLLVVAMLVGCLTSCDFIKKLFGKDEPEVTPNTDVTQAVYKKAEYNTTTSVMPSNWNEMTYADGNDTQIMSYIGSSFFSYDYKFENDQKFLADGSINKDAIVDGAFTTNYDAATKLEDVTSSVDAKWGYTQSQKAEGGYAWKITLRTDLKWDDGTPIKAVDFVESMKDQLDPAFMNFRANTYYDTLKIKNSRGYFFQNQAGTYESVSSQGYATNAAALAAGAELYWDAYDFWGAKGYVDAEGNPCPQWLSMNDETVYNSVEAWADPDNEEIQDAFNGKVIWNYYFAPDSGAYAGYVEVGASYSDWISVYVPNAIRYVAWEDVGIYAVDEYSFVVCLDKAYSFLNDDGSLSVWAAYYMSSLPLIHQTLYDTCIKEPAAGSTLYTSNYNSSLETTASWGPYKLVEFEAGSHYKLVVNEHWYGWNMETNKNQYNITAINCRKVEKPETVWMSFLSGDVDDASLGDYNINEYLDSKYVSFSEGSTGTYGMQLYSNLPVLKESGNNNSILAIAEFRQAFNLALNRSDVIEKIWPGTTTPCFGLVNVAYYYDVENAANLYSGGKYRNTVEAKAGILRAYGYTQDANGKWSINDLTGMTLDDAYETLTGYNLTLAKEKVRAAIAELEANAEYYGYDATKDVTFVYGSSSDTDKQRFRAEYLQGVLDTLVAGTSLEGRIKVVFDASAGNQWAEAFRSGATQIGFGYGFQGNAFNPFDIVGAFVNPDDDLNYHMYWDTSAVNLTLTMPVVEGKTYEGQGQTITMSAQNWYFCLNGTAAEYEAPVVYNWDAGFAPVEARLLILSALEELTIKESRSIMLIADSGGSFLGAKFSYLSDSYNTFMGFGGIRYMVVNYTDAEWAAHVAANGGDLSAEYKKSE